MTNVTGNAATLDDRSGYEQVQALARGEYPASPMTKLMPFETLPPTKGHLKFQATPDTTHLNGFGVVHGGWAMTMLDNAMGLAAHSMVGPHEFCPSLETSVRFLAKIVAGGPALTITADVASQDGRKIIVDGAISAPDGKVLATGTSTCLIMRAEG